MTGADLWLFGALALALTFGAGLLLGHRLTKRGLTSQASLYARRLAAFDSLCGIGRK